MEGRTVLLHLLLLPRCRRAAAELASLSETFQCCYAAAITANTDMQWTCLIALHLPTNAEARRRVRNLAGQLTARYLRASPCACGGPS